MPTFAFATGRPVKHLYLAFQASSPRNYRVAFAALFLSIVKQAQGPKALAEGFGTNASRLQGQPVPRFYFHTETDVRVTDAEGQEFANFEDARREAIHTCGKMMSDAADAFWGSRPWNVSVTDETGLIMWEIYVDGQTSAAGRNLEPQLSRESDGPIMI